MERALLKLAAIGLLIATSGVAWAAPITPAPPSNYTGINTNSLYGGGAGVSQDGSSNELPLVLANYYGGAGATISGNVYGTLTISGGTLGANSILLVRQQDSGGSSPLNLNGSNGGSANDGIWQGDANLTVNLTAAAIIAANGQRFGYLNEATDTMVPIFGGSQASLPGPVNGLPIGAGPIAWYDRSSNGDTFFSDASKNTNSSSASAFTTEDHMLTWEAFSNNTSTPLVGGSAATWLIAFEDTPFTMGSDADYNDLVVQISADVPSNTVPLPLAGWAGLAMMGVMGGVMLVRRRRLGSQ